MYVAGLKKIPRDELRVIFRGFGIDTRRIRDISFIGKAITVLVVYPEYREEISRLLAAKSFQVLTGFDPACPTQCRSYEANQTDAAAQAVKRTVKRLCTDAAHARSRQRPGLADFYMSQGAEVLARAKVAADSVPEEAERLFHRFRTSGYTAMMDEYLSEAPPAEGAAHLSNK
jgi:hypothetical protein